MFLPLLRPPSSRRPDLAGTVPFAPAKAYDFYTLHAEVQLKGRLPLLDVIQITDNLYSFPIPLPENPLKWLNCYVIKGGSEGRDLLIDTGFRRDECRQALLSGMKELAMKPETTDVFLTHLHADHSGNAGMLQKMGCRLLMGKRDYEITSGKTGPGWPGMKERMLQEGMPAEVLNTVMHRNPAVLYSSEGFTAEFVSGGEVLSYGGYGLHVLDMAGHTPGQLCLYEPRKKIMFTADHVLFDITPNICYWQSMEDALGVYLDNLRRMSTYDVKLALPAHRGASDITLQQRIGVLLRHHETRLAETKRIIEEQPGSTGYEIAGKMTWKIHARNWEEFPPGQKWFAMGEALAHLEYLLRRGFIRCEYRRDSCVYYSAAKPGPKEEDFSSIHLAEQ